MFIDYDYFLMVLMLLPTIDVDIVTNVGLNVDVIDYY